MAELSNGELRAALLELGEAPGPITATTRGVWLKKLEGLRGKATKVAPAKAKAATKAAAAAKTEPSPSQQRRTRASRRGAPETVTIGDSDDESALEAAPAPPKPPARRQSRGSPARPANATIPGLAYFAKARPTAAVQPKPQPKPSRGNAASAGYSDTDSPSPIKLDRSANTSFLPPPASPPSARSTSSSFGRHSPFLSGNVKDIDYGFGGSRPRASRPLLSGEEEEDEGGTTVRRRKSGTSPFAAVSNKFKAAVGSLFPTTKAGTKRGHLPAKPRTGLGSGGGDSLATFLVWSLAGFLFLIGLGYASIVYQKELRVAVSAVQSAGVDTASHLYQYLVLPVLGVCLFAALIASLYFLRKHRAAAAESEREELFRLVGKICEVLETQSEAVESGLAKEAGCPIPYVRDQLIPHKERAAKADLWNKAVAYINDSEGRVRTESVFRNGVETAIWLWLPPPTAKPGWNGHAFGDVGGAGDAGYAEREPFSECLKVRGMMPDERERAEVGEAWTRGIQDAVLHKLSGKAQVVHVAVDRKAPEGCVYLKLTDKNGAAEAYRALHGSWYSGNIVSVKYLRPERYHQRFPAAARAHIPLQPTA